MDEVLFTLTTAIDFIGLTTSLWLGFYIVTRSPRSRISWLASATLWSLSGSFLNSLIYLHAPPGGGRLPWWWGWSIAFAVPFWFHLSVALLPAKSGRKQRWLVYLVYFLTLNLVAIEAYTPFIYSGSTLREPIYNSAQRPGLLYAVFGLYLSIVPILALNNLRHGWQKALSPQIRRQFVVLLIAAALAVISGIYGSVSTWLELDTPRLINDLGLVLGVLLLGYGVAQWNALVEGRVIRLDFIYTALVFGFVVGLYLMAAILSNLIFEVPFVTFILIIVLAIASHSLYDWTRSYLDRLIYRPQHHRQLRANLRTMAQSVSSEEDLQQQLRTILRSICQSFAVTRGFIALCEERDFIIYAEQGFTLSKKQIPFETLSRDEITFMSPPIEILELHDAALILPLHAGGDQIGAVVFGDRPSYTEDEVFLLEDTADIVANVVHTMRLQDQSVQQVEDLVSDFQRREMELRESMREALGVAGPPLEFIGETETEAISKVDDALRHLQDYAYLGDNELAHLDVLTQYIELVEGTVITHIDRGKGLHAVLVTAINKLRPSGKMPSPPTREWHPFIILHDCYVEGKLNRDVMSELYISEGTFNRTRRRAIRSVAKALGEMERYAQPWDQR